MSSQAIIDLSRPRASYMVCAVGSLKERESPGRAPSNLDRSTRVRLVQLYEQVFGKSAQPPVFDNHVNAECGVVVANMRLGSADLPERQRHRRSRLVHDGVVQFDSEQREAIEGMLLAFARELATDPEFDTVSVTFDGVALPVE